MGIVLTLFIPDSFLALLTNADSCREKKDSLLEGEKQTIAVSDPLRISDSCGDQHPLPSQ